MSLPFLKLAGDAYTQGLAEGKELQDSIAHNLEVYFRRFGVEGGLTRGEVLDRAERYLGAIEEQNRGYFEGLQGIAAGGGFKLLEIAALNLRYEIIYHQFAHEAPQGCTAFALMPSASADGLLWMGQNWDWIPEVRGALVETQEPDGTKTLSFTEAGIFGGKIGLNSHGIGLCINGLVSANDDWARLGKPFHLRTYEALRSETLDAASSNILQEPRSGSANFLIGQGDKAVDLEVSPGAYALWEDARLLVHANHFVAPEKYGIQVPRLEWLDRSNHRHSRLSQILLGSERPGLEALMQALRDSEGHPYAVCRHPSQEELALGDPYQTVASVIMNLGTRELWISDGPPDNNPYEHYQLL